MDIKTNVAWLEDLAMHSGINGNSQQEQVLVQVFRDDTNGQVLSASIAQRSAALDLWQSPLPLRPV